MLNLFVRAHDLTSENNGAVLGVEREKSDAPQPSHLLRRHYVEFDRGAEEQVSAATLGS